MDTAAAQIALRKAKRSLHGGMYRRIKAVAPIATRAASINARGIECCRHHPLRLINKFNTTSAVLPKPSLTRVTSRGRGGPVPGHRSPATRHDQWNSTCTSSPASSQFRAVRGVRRLDHAEARVLQDVRHEPPHEGLILDQAARSRYGSVQTSEGNGASRPEFPAARTRPATRPPPRRDPAGEVD